MAYPSITGRNLTSGIHVTIQYLNEVTDQMFMPGIILLLYIVLGLSMYLSQRRMTGRGDMAVCLAASGYIMVGFCVTMGMIPGIINGIVIVEVIIMAIVGTLWLYFSKRGQSYY